MLPIDKRLIQYNHSSRGGHGIKYIVVHDTGNTSKGADALAHYRYFNGGNRQASAHYFVDDKTIIQTVEENRAAWHCGDGRGRYGITNQNSLGVEICINSDGDYKKAVAHTVELVKHLREKHNIPIEQVVRHFDASRKLCPGTMRENNWANWEEFKQALLKKEGEEMLEHAVVIGSLADFPAAEVLAQLVKAPIYLRGLPFVAQKVYVVGGGLEGIEAEEIVDLSGEDRLETAAKVKQYLVGQRSEEDLDKALELLSTKGLINSPDYWRENAREGKTVRGDFVAILLKRVAAYL